jgi:hypothetical protein
MKASGIRLLSVLVIFTIFWMKSAGQTAVPDALNGGSLTEQMKYLEEKTRIYENYRAIREDMFQKIKINTIDSINSAKSRIAELVAITRIMNSKVDSLNKSLVETKDELDKMTRTKNSISVLGIEINKVTYNTIMWIIVASLVFLLLVGFLAFKRNLTITRNTRKDLDELKTEFENYRQKSRLEREKMSMDHFNELKKLKGK